VLYFYPKDDTPGCTIEAKEFSKTLKEFRARNASVIGVSGGDQRSKEKFCAKHSLSVPLVSDSDFKVSRAYGVYGDKKFMGRSFKGIFRKTFILDSKGTVVKVFEAVKPEGHASEVLRAIDAIKRTGIAAKKPAASRPGAKKAAAKKAPVRKPAAKRLSARKKAAPSRRKAPARAVKAIARKKK